MRDSDSKGCQLHLCALFLTSTLNQSGLFLWSANKVEWRVESLEAVQVSVHMDLHVLRNWKWIWML